MPLQEHLLIPQTRTPTNTPTRTPTNTPTSTPTRTPTPTPTQPCVYQDFVSVDDYHWWDECPGVGQPCPSGTGEPTCAGFTGSGFVTSRQFLKSCVQGLTPSANVNMNFDNYGTIGTLTGYTPNECSTLANASGVIPVELVDEGNYVRLRLSYTYQNSQSGGPYGITGSVNFSFS